MPSWGPDLVNKLILISISKKLISVIFLTNFSSAKSIDFMLSDNQDI